MFLHVSVILLKEVGGGCLPQCMLGYTPGQTPWASPPFRSACWDMVNKRAVRILLECNRVSINVHVLVMGYSCCIIGQQTNVVVSNETNKDVRMYT